MITVENLTKTYGTRRAVDNLSFEVQPGRVTGFVGPNGSGKSTTMRMMVGLTRPDDGHVHYNGTPYHQLDRPVATIGAALDASAHPGRTARNHLRTMCAASGLAGRGPTKCSMRSVSPVSPTSASVVSRSACANASPSPVHCSVNPRRCCSTSPPMGSTPMASVGCEASFVVTPNRGGAVLVSSHLIAELALFADDLVVIGAGRLLTAAPVHEIVDSAEHSVLVETPQRNELIVLLGQHGISVGEAGARLSIAGASRSDIAQLALDHQIRLDELVDHRASLEDLLVDLTQRRRRIHLGLKGTIMATTLTRPSTSFEPTPPATSARHRLERHDSRFIASLRSEWIKLTTVRAPRAILALTILVGGAASFMVARFVDEPDLSVANVFGFSAVFTAVFAAVSGILAYTTEAEHHTAHQTFAAEPRRGIVIAAKADHHSRLLRVARLGGPRRGCRRRSTRRCRGRGHLDHPGHDRLGHRFRRARRHPRARRGSHRPPERCSDLRRTRVVARCREPRQRLRPRTRRALHALLRRQRNARHRRRR